MPILNNPPRQLGTMVEKIQSDSLAQSRDQQAFNGITEEVIQDILPDGSYVVANVVLTTTGVSTPIQIGDIVKVGWRGGVAQAILAHTSRRAKFVPIFLGGGSVVEEIFIAKDPKNHVNDIWFRNLDQITALNLTAIASTGFGGAANLLWGQDTVRFLVFQNFTLGSTIYVCKLNRVANKVYPKGRIAKATIEQTILPSTALNGTGVTNIHQYYLDDRGHVLAVVVGVDLGDTLVYDLTASPGGGAPLIQSLPMVAPSPPILPSGDPGIAFINANLMPPGWTVFSLGPGGPPYGVGHTAIVSHTAKGVVTQYYDISAGAYGSMVFLPPPTGGPAYDDVINVFAGNAIAGVGAKPNQVVGLGAAQIAGFEDDPNFPPNTRLRPVNQGDIALVFELNLFHAMLVHTVQGSIAQWQNAIRLLKTGAETPLGGIQPNAFGNAVLTPFALLSPDALYYTNDVQADPKKTENSFVSFKFTVDPTVKPPSPILQNISGLAKLTAKIIDLATYPGWTGFTQFWTPSAINFQLVTDSAVSGIPHP